MYLCMYVLAWILITCYDFEVILRFDGGVNTSVAVSLHM